MLSGGIADDFNNLLMAVLGNRELMSRRLSSDSTVRDLIDRAIHASRRAADLTRRMLAYSGKSRFVIEDVDLQERDSGPVRDCDSAHLRRSRAHEGTIIVDSVEG